ncbi:MAG TPA: GntG family PLP-dependent aldolase [Verrucomicrobiota bacterium]|nr:GntG family PLP-dependent aldolase [Verrucomicrobiota bacterium]HNU52061.1 GntG family PLP-dependent aldolase [Verrucomicrobiota bacterium]
MNPNLSVPRVVDLRSDTVTLPTAAMRRAMAEAEVGDDVFGDDPTVQRLEARTADLLGKEAAVFVPSGTMGNQIALRAHTEPGDEIVVESEAHIYYYEGGAPAALSGVMCRCVAGRRGVFRGTDLESVLRPPDVHFARTRLVCIENTHNRGGGSLWPLEAILDVAATARRHDLRLHLDGARLWNAAVATGIPERDYAAPFDSVNVCFSKGLGAPVGSALAGTREFIARARRFRKQFGGGMRQAGLLAAAALHALEHHRERLAEDHAHARYLAAALARLPGVGIDPDAVQTNIVRFQVTRQSAREWVETLAAAGVRVLATGPDAIRAVTNLNVNRADIEYAAGVLARVAASEARQTQSSPQADEDPAVPPNSSSAPR